MNFLWSMVQHARRARRSAGHAPVDGDGRRGSNPPGELWGEGIEIVMAIACLVAIALFALVLSFFF